MLKIHILNVGHGDCIAIEFMSGRVSIVDINRSSEMDSKSFDEVISESYGDRVLGAKLSYSMGLKSYAQLLQEAGYDIALTDPIAYLKTLCTGKKIFRFISTHPHMDHLTGLNTLHNEIGVVNFWIPSNTFKPNMDDLNASEKEDWKLYQELREGAHAGVTVVRPLRGEQREFWQEDGIHILAPNISTLSSATAPNDISYVIIVIYGQHKVILGGDAEKDTWDYLVKNSPLALKGATLLKASHHGRDSGYHQEAVKLMSPGCTVISVGKKPENDASQKYNQYSNKVLSTRWYGTIRFELNEDGSGTYYPEYPRK